MNKEIIILGIIISSIFLILCLKVIYTYFKFKPGAGRKGFIDVEVKESIDEKIKNSMYTKFYRILDVKLVERTSVLSDIGYTCYKLVKFEYWI